MVDRYLIKDATGLVVNVVLWDGDADTWEAPKGCVAVKLDGASTVGPGDKVDAGNKVTRKFDPTKDAAPNG